MMDYNMVIICGVYVYGDDVECRRRSTVDEMMGDNEKLVIIHDVTMLHTSYFLHE